MNSWLSYLLHKLVTVRCSNNQFHAFSHALGLQKYLQSSLLLAFLKSVIKIFLSQCKSLGNSLYPVLAAYHTHQYCFTVALNSLRDCIHLLFLVLHLKSNLGQDYLFISDFYCFSHNGIVFCD